MNKLKYLIQCFKQHQRNIEAVIIVVVIAAVLIFGPNGENSNNKNFVNEKTDNTQNEEQIKDEEKENISGSDDENLQVESDSAYDENMYVDISGCIKKPGIYKIERNTRLFEVIEMAGGLTKNADYNGFNQAEHIEDGDKIIIPSKANNLENNYEGSKPGTSSGKININSADTDLLEEIPGVGPSTAQKIIEYRESNGRFHNIDELKNVNGIGEKTFEKMSGKITV